LHACRKDTQDLTIVSKDSDFQQRALLYGHPPKVVWLRLGNCSTSSVLAVLQSRQADILSFAADATSSYLVLS
jgi:predicted nuclease of predicted toxin-antitoxin system